MPKGRKATFDRLFFEKQRELMNQWWEKWKKFMPRKLKELRERHSLTKSEVAKILGVTPPEINNLENPQSGQFPKLHKLLMLSLLYNDQGDFENMFVPPEIWKEMRERMKEVLQLLEQARQKKADKDKSQSGHSGFLSTAVMEEETEDSDSEDSNYESEEEEDDLDCSKYKRLDEEDEDESVDVSTARRSPATITGKSKLNKGIRKRPLFDDEEE